MEEFLESLWSLSLLQNYRVHKTPPLDPSLAQTNPVQTFTSYFETPFSIVLQLLLPKWVLSLRQACSTFCDKGPQPLLWAGLGAARVKITIIKKKKCRGKIHARRDLEGPVAE